MKRNLLILDSCKKIEGYLQDISRHVHGTDGVQNELFAFLEATQDSLGGQIIQLFIEMCLQFFSGLLLIFLSIGEKSENDRINRDRKFSIDNYIRLNMHRDINEKEVADFIGMSNCYFSRFFGRMFQCSFVEYLTHSRIISASNLLVFTDMKIVEISDISGFHSHNQFNRVFKEEMKITPSEYREMYKRGQASL